MWGGVKMNLAILLGVSNYINFDDLPGCKNDVDIMYQLIRKTGKYQDILFLSENTTSQNVKHKVSEFIRKHSESEDVNEIFFYYTGHGLFHKDEFHFVLSDFDEKRLYRTTYMNSEIDDLLRALNPNLTVKVIDACHSGVRYVKDVNELEVTKVLNVSKEKFKNCYFMFSSQFDEKSWATQKISYFTQSFINSIINHETNSIRYRDIMDYISDDFLQKDIAQTPYYITQSTNTEIFCSIDEDTKDMLKEILASFEDNQIEQENKETAQLTLLEIVKKDAENYCKDIGEVHSLLEKIKQKINDFSLNGELNELYKVNITFENELYDDIPNIDAVAKALEDKAKEYFIEIEYVEKTVRVPIRTVLSEAVIALYGSKPTKYTEQTRTVVSSFNISEDNVPYTTIKIDFEPNFPNIPKYNCTIIYAFSKVHICLFYSYNIYNEVSWGEYELDNIKWRQSEEFIIKQDKKIEEKIESIKLGFIEFVKNDLNDRFKRISEKDGELLKENEGQKEEVKESTIKL
jgi:hypothetical protein